MAPKKSKTAPHEFPAVEKAFYELQLTDCNRKLARLRKAVDDYELRNEEIKKSYDELDEDRADIISFLKKNLTVKTEENAEMKETIKNLEELREEETTKFHETVTELQNSFTKMKDQLTSENKLLAGKLNTLEEFRAIRDDLMIKFEKQEHAFEDQEMKYKRILYNTEKKFVAGKDQLKKEMEERLLQLAQQFQDASEMRIAASTHRVIRENIALNNQLDSLLMTQEKVTEQNDKYREDVRASRCAMEVAEEERDKAINKSLIQLKVIKQLTTAFEDVKKQKAMYDKKQFDFERNELKMQKLTKDNENLSLKVRILEQNLHATLSDQNETVVETAKLLRERETFKNILQESANAVQGALKLDEWSNLDPCREILDRKIVLKRILDVINQYRSATQAESMESLISLTKIYEKGDLGFDFPKESPPRKSLHTEVPSPIQSIKEKRSAISLSSTSSVTGSLKTIPSIKVMSIDEEGSLPTPKDSLPSFTVASIHSSISIGGFEETVVSEVSKMLELSRMDVQKSLMADLALSQISQKMSVAKLSVSRTSEIGEPRDSLRSQHEPIPKEKSGSVEGQVRFDEASQNIGDTDEATQVEGVAIEDSSKPTQDTNKSTKDVDKSTQDTVEDTQDAGERLPEIGHKDDKKKKKK